eukprot:4837360-Amphidinium_carterae.1
MTYMSSKKKWWVCSEPTKPLKHKGPRYPAVFAEHVSLICLGLFSHHYCFTLPPSLTCAANGKTYAVHANSSLPDLTYYE